MAGNSIGHLFRITSFGESHGKLIGVVIDGCPAGIDIDMKYIQYEVNRRRPGQSNITTPRDEKDIVENISGVFEGKSTGMPLAFVIKNEDTRSEDYSNIANILRPSHADYTYYEKYGIHDYRGGGRSSARETATRVIAGAVAKLFLNKLNISINAYVSAVGNIKISKNVYDLDLSKTEDNIIRCPDNKTALKMIKFIEEIKAEGDSIGGIVSCIIKGMPIGLGEPVFDKLQADLGKAILSINAVKGFEYGSGFEGTKMKGSEHNDIFYKKNNKIQTKTNNAGGILGGISSGNDIYFNVAFKPVATIMKKQESLDKDGNNITLMPKGRHDPCVLPRAVPIVEAMAAITIADHILLSNSYKQ
ncbi:MAG: chorismate synthase [Bacteroidetes bacterium GWE2_29_8]|nr:MAG: chorismate synthase [Bacteroidetes bacterium GWE2_29_8]